MRLLTIANISVILAAGTAVADELQPPTLDLESEIPELDLDVQAPPTVELEFDDESSKLVVPDPFRACSMPEGELQALRSKALDYLFVQHPELNQSCERLKKGIAFAMDEQVCFFESAIVREETCREQGQLSYYIVLSFEDLEPKEVIWFRKSRFIPRYQGDLDHIGGTDNRDKYEQ